jgi:hypothetical protein
MEKLIRTVSFCCLVLLITMPVQAQKLKVRAVYDVYFGGFYILQTVSEFSQNKAAYQIKSQTTTQGTLKFFFDWMGNASSEGIFMNSQAIPNRHSNIGQRAGKIRLVKLVYDTFGKISYTEIIPPSDPQKVMALPKNAQLGTIDPLSVISQLTNNIDSGYGCAGNFSVYDGRRRYDVQVIDNGTLNLPKTPSSIFSGPVTACKVDYAPLGGQQREQSKYAETARERIVYVARPIIGGPTMPVGLIIDTAYGTITAHLSGLDFLEPELELNPY